MSNDVEMATIFRVFLDHPSYVAKTKALISFAVTAKLICVFAFAYAHIKCCCKNV